MEGTGEIAGLVWLGVSNAACGLQDHFFCKEFFLGCFYSAFSGLKKKKSVRSDVIHDCLITVDDVHEVSNIL